MSHGYVFILDDIEYLLGQPIFAHEIYCMWGEWLNKNKLLKG